MSNSLIIDKTTHFLGTALNVNLKRQGVINTNIANIDTSGYQAKDVNFKKALDLAIEAEAPGKMLQTHPNHFKLTDPLKMSGGTNVTGAVDIDREMARLAENNIQYRTSVELLLRKMSMIRNTIIDGGR